MKDDPARRTEFGFLAQEVAPVFPELVRADGKGYSSLNYIGLIAPLTEALREQQAQLDGLAAETRELTQRLDALERRGDEAGDRYNP
jgi:hypothetical protein